MFEAEPKGLPHPVSADSKNQEKVHFRYSPRERETLPHANEEETRFHDEENGWLIYISPESETGRIESIMQPRLKREISNENFSHAWKSSQELDTKAEEKLHEIATELDKKLQAIRLELHQAFLQKIEVFNPFAQDYDIILPRGFERDTTLQEEAKTQELVAWAQARKEALAPLSQRALAALPQRNIVLEHGSQDNSIQQKILDAEKTGKEIIKDLSDQLRNTSDIQKKRLLAESILTTAELVEKKQLLLLGHHIPFYITVAKNRLNYLSNLSSEMACKRGIQELQPFLEEIRTLFLFAEAESTERALTVIHDILDTISSEMNPLYQEIETADSDKLLVREEDQQFFDEEIECKKMKLQFLETVKFTYQQIQSELTIEAKYSSLADLKASIEGDLEKLRTPASHISLHHEALCNLGDDLEISTTAPLTSPQRPLHFLNDIHHISNDEMVITGEHGKIILEDLEQASELTRAACKQSDKDRKKWNNGINLVRFAIARKYGLHAVGLFDQQFKSKKRFDISLSVKDLKGFLRNHTSLIASHFLNPTLFIERVQQPIRDAHENDILKFSKAVLSFNPFLPNTTITNEEEAKALHQKESAAGISAARDIVEKKFQSFSLSKIRLFAILQRFDAQFEHSSHLTVQDLTTFLDTETEKLHSPAANSWSDFWRNHFADDTKRGFISGAASGVASLGIALIGHHLLIPMNIVYFCIGGGIGFTTSHILNTFRAPSALSTAALRR